MRNDVVGLVHGMWEYTPNEGPKTGGKEGEQENLKWKRLKQKNWRSKNKGETPGC